MSILYAICLTVSVFCFWLLVKCWKLFSKKEKLITLAIAILALVLFVVFFAVEISSGSGGGGSSKKEYDYVTRPDGTREWYDPDYAYRVD